MVDDRLQVAIQAVASRMLRKVVEMAVDDPMEFWGSHMEDVGEYDADSVVLEMRRLAERIDVSDPTFEASYEYLSARADAE